MSDLVHQDSLQGPCIVTFDGRVLELFNELKGSAERLIVGMLYVYVAGPDRKGRRQVNFTCVAESRAGGGFELRFTEDQWASAEPFVREVATAAAAAA
jgi:hypothetical protein